MDTPRFLALSDYERYRSAVPKFRRDAVRADAHAGVAATTPTPLARTVAGRASELVKAPRPGIHGFVVQARDGDGMSWVATDVVKELHAQQPDLHCVDLAERGLLAGSRPAVFSILPRDGVLDAAMKSKYCTEVRRTGWRRRAFILVALAGVAVIAGVLGALQKQRTQHGAVGSYLDPVVVLAAALLALSPLLSKWLERWVFPSASSEELERQLVSAISDEQRRRERVDEFDRFVDGMVRLLGSLRAPSVFVVDGYDGLDLVSQEVIGRHLGDAGRPSRKGTWELWVIFERRSSQQMWQRAYNRRDDVDPFPAFGCLRLRELSTTQREQLADAAGHPERRSYLGVKDICGAANDWVKVLRHDLIAHRESHPRLEGRTSSLDVLYLLAIGSAERGSPIFEPASLRTALSRSMARTKPLKRALPGGALHPTEVDELVKDVLVDFPQCIRLEETDGPRSFRVLEATAEALVLERERLGLAAPGRVHAFWALLWHDEFGDAPHPYAIRKAAGHFPHATVAEGDDEVRDVLYTGARRTSQEALRHALVDDLAPMLERASALAGSAAERRDVARLCLESFALTRNPVLLDLLLDLDPTVLGRHGRRTALSDIERTFAALFLGSVAGPTGDDPRYVDLVSSADDFFVDYSIEQTLWQLLTTAWLYPAESARRLPECLHAHSLLSRLHQRVIGRLDPALTQRSDARNRSNNRTPRRRATEHVKVRFVVDLFTLSHCVADSILHFAIAQQMHAAQPPSAQPLATTDVGAIPEALLDLVTAPLHATIEEVLEVVTGAALVAVNLDDEGRRTGTASDLVVAGGARELAALCRAALAVLRHGAALPESLLADISSVETLLRPLDEMPNTTSRERVERELYVLHLAWRGLGFVDLANSLALRSAQISGLLGHQAKEWDGPLTAAREESGTRAFFAWSYAAMFEWSDENRAVQFYNAVAALLPATRGTYRARLALLALDVIGGYPIDATPILQALLIGIDPTPPLAALLDTVSDDDLRPLTVDVLNAVNNATDGTLRGRVDDLLRTRADRIADAREAAALLATLHAHSVAARRGDGLDAAHEFTSWPYDHAGSTYIWFLSVLIAADATRSDPAIADGLRILREQAVGTSLDANVDALAVWICRRLTARSAVDDEDVETCLQVISRVAGTPDVRLGIDRMIDMYTLLVQNGHADEENRRKLDDYRREKIRRDEIQIVRPYLGAGRYFEVFRYYALTLASFGLPGFDEATRDEEECLHVAESLGAWLEEHGVPRPFANIDDVVALNVSFIVVGDAVLALGGEEAPEAIANAFRTLERLSFENLDRLFLLGVQLDIGRELRSLLERHRSQYSPQRIGKPREAVPRATAGSLGGTSDR